MAMRDEVREQQNKLKGKTFKEKLNYFWDYYKVHTIALVFAIIVISVFVKDIVTNKDNAFSAVILNSYAHDTQEGFQADFAAYAGIDTDTYSCLIDTSATFSVGSMSQYDIAFAQRIPGANRRIGRLRGRYTGLWPLCGRIPFPGFKGNPQRG